MKQQLGLGSHIKKGYIKLLFPVSVNLLKNYLWIQMQISEQK